MALLAASCALYGQNQTEDWTPIQSQDSLPFQISIVQSDFQLPSDFQNGYGIQSFVSAVYHGKWLLLGGRTNGLHGFNADNNNFPPRKQNTMVYVVDPKKRQPFMVQPHLILFSLYRKSN